jgi:hypothetical protein
MACRTHTAVDTQPAPWPTVRLSTDYTQTLCCGSRARTVQEGRVRLFIVILGLQHGVALEVRVLELLIRLFAQLGGERAIEEEDPNTAC